MSISILRSSSAVITLLAAAAAPASAQFSPSAEGFYGQAGIYGQAPTGIVIGGSVQTGVPSSLIIQNRSYGGYYPQASTVIIIQQPVIAPAYQSYCTTSVIGSPIPATYARDSVTGAVCR